MAILHNGLFGKVTGKLGNTIIYGSFDKMLVRMKGKVSKPPTALQLRNRKEMAVVAELLEPVKPFIRLGFAQVAKAEGMYAYHKAVSLNKRYALSDSSQEVEMDYARVYLSMGDLVGLNNVQVSLVEEGLRFTWDPGVWMMANAQWDDQVMLMAYFPDVSAGDAKYKRAYFELSGAKRGKGSDLLSLPAELITLRMEVYVSVVSNDRRNIANSEYVGRLN